MFNDIVFTNMCSYQIIDINGDLMDAEKCREYNGGILQQGLYSAIVKFYDTIVQLHNDFLSLERNNDVVNEFTLSKTLYLLEEMEDYYFKSALKVLSYRLEEDIAI